jgi:predicted TPR repeat methyltransferase
MTLSNSSEAERLCEEGYLLLEASRFEEAHSLLSRARARAPANPLIHYRLGLLYSDTGRSADALEALDTSLGLQPGNPRAHNNRGSALQRLGRISEAEHAFRRALALGPELPMPYINLGHLLEQQGKKREAVELYEHAIARGLDAATFGHHIAAAAGHVTDRAPDHWVRATFDNFAPNFDAHLDALRYDVPRQLAKFLQPHATSALDILDLGCGTGLSGLAMAQQKRFLVGVDLSEKMLARARLRGIYDELHVSEVHAWLRGGATERFDVVIAADVLIYIGALDELFREGARVLRPGGSFVFSTEECAETDYSLLPTGRYAQSQAYIRRLAETRFNVVNEEAAVIRMESGVPIAGRCYLLRTKQL